MLFAQLGVIVTVCLGVAAGSTSTPSQDATTLKNKRQVPATHELHERQHAHWAGRWEKRNRVPASTLLPMRIGLVQTNLEAGAHLLNKISDPKSPDYGKHISADEVIDMFSPPEAAVAAVKDWLLGAGFNSSIISLSTNKQWIQFDAPAKDVEDLLFADFFEYEHRSSGSKTVAVHEYHVPLHLRQHIDYITPGIKLRANPAKLKRMRRRQEQGALKERQGKHTQIKLRAEPTKLNRIRRRQEQGALKKRQGKPTRPSMGILATIGGLPPLNASVCDIHVTAACIRAQYHIPNNTLAAPGNELGFFEGVDDHYSRKALDIFFATLHPYIPQGTYPEERLIDGAIGAVEDVPGYNRSDEGGESDLDIEAAWSLIWPQKTVLFQTDDQYYEVNQTSSNSPYLGSWNTFYDALDGSYCTSSAYNETGDCTRPECLDPVYPNPNPGGYKGQLQCGVYKPTNVISISYGGGEADLPLSYYKRQCDEIMKLSLQGVTVVESSGDFGVAGDPPGSNSTGYCAGPDSTVFYPGSDVTCPYVLAVGGTKFVHVSNSSNYSTKYYESSTGWSGGGFSNYFDAPEWQKHAISSYFDEVTLGFEGYKNAGTNFSDVGKGVYRLGGRGYPDVSAIGAHYVTFSDGLWHSDSGTSLSAPIWAAVLTLINERRLAANKSTVGFVHPVLYAHPEVFTDITEGSNPGCNTTGFLAAKGWDPVNGLGTPIFPKLVDLFLSLP